MTKYKKWLENYTAGVNFPQISGFEILEMLQVRSQLAQIENRLSLKERVEIENADAKLLKASDMFYTNLSKIANLKDLRVKNQVLPSHWWWYLDILVLRKEIATANA